MTHDRQCDRPGFPGSDQQSTHCRCRVLLDRKLKVGRWGLAIRHIAVFVHNIIVVAFESTPLQHFTVTDHILLVGALIC